MQCFESPGHNGIGFPTVHVSYSQYNAPTVHGQQDTFAEQKMHPSHNKQWFKTVHEYFKDSDEQHRLPYDKAVLRPLVGRPYSFREQYREKSIVFTPPFPHRGFRFPAVQHTPCLFRLQSMLQTCQWTS
ncbi:hypothetical protein TNCT_673351 [Trichonephila clavata]|uniref:Uncharacterized protein n=1 Tax=Trichonephila clavata TaxID=2740835 RepID=A0A8X6KXC3_TRICU|nr:hypothetical protein TNCT_673351 [Trichonephila clavata]